MHRSLNVAPSPGTVYDLKLSFNVDRLSALPEVFSGGAGLLSTVEDMSKLARCIAQYGALQDGSAFLTRPCAPARKLPRRGQGVPLTIADAVPLM